jgi:hypothetical protein
MIHTILKSAQETETKAFQLLTHPYVKITPQRSDVMEVVERHLATWIDDLYQQQIPISPALIHEKVVNLHEAVKELEEKEA